MALLKDTTVSGNLRVTDSISADKIQTPILEAPIESGSTTYSVGADGQVLKSNGTTVYWGAGGGSAEGTVTGVKGDAESSYRTEDVNITAANVGAVAISQGSGNAGKFLMVNSSGNVEPTSVTTQAASTWTPTTSNQTIAAGTYITGTQTIAGDADLKAANIKKDVNIFGVTGTFTTTPSGKTALTAAALRSGYAGFINGAQVNGSMPDGSATTPTTTIDVEPTISVSSTGLISVIGSTTESVTPTVSAGYISSGTAGNVTASVSETKQLTTQAASTWTPTTSNQTIAAGTYITGKQTIAGDADLKAANIKKDVDIFGVTGTFTTTPSDKTALTAAALRSGYAGFINGAQVNGSMADTTVTEGTTTVSGTTATRGNWSQTAGYTASRTINAATFANSATSGTTYVDISATTSAPVLVSNNYLYINKGWTDNLKISLAKLVPDGASADLASGVILSGYSAYNNDGALVAGNIPTKTASDLSASGKTVTVPKGYYASQVTKDVATGSATTPATTITSEPTITVSDAGLITASNSKTQSVTPTVSAGYISSGTAGTITVNGSKTNQLTTKAATTYYATASDTKVSGATASDIEADSQVEVRVAIDPVQDLHQQTSPWMGGSKKNLFDARKYFVNRTASGVKSTVLLNGYIYLQGKPTSSVRYSASAPNLVLPAGTYIATGSPRAVRVRTSAGIIDTDGVFTSDGETPIYLSVSVSTSTTYDTFEMIQIEAGDTATDWVAYENICPITGFESVNIYQSDKNLLGTTVEEGKVISPGGFTIPNSDFSITEFVPVTAGSSYVYSFTKNTDTTDTNYRRVHGYNANKQWVEQLVGTGFSSSDVGARCSLSFTVPSGVSYVQISGRIEDTDRMLEAGTTATTYSAVNNTYTISMPAGEGKVYSGDLTVYKDGTGVLVLDSFGISFTPDSTWTIARSGTASCLFRYSGTRPAAKCTSTSTSSAQAIDKCSHFARVAVTSSSTSVGFTVYNSYVQFRPVNASTATVDSWKAYITEQYNAGTPVTVCYRINTNKTYVLSAQQVTALLGTNNIWSNAGATDIVYNGSTTTDSIIDAQVFTTGEQKIAGITTANLLPTNIKDGVTVSIGDASDADRITSVTGAFTDASTVSAGQTAATANKIMSGYSAWVDGAEVQGTLANGSVTPAVNSHSITTTPAVTGAIGGTVTSIGTTTKPSGTDGTNYWTINPTGSVTTTGVSTANAKATVVAGYIASSPANSNDSTVNITPSVVDGAKRYIVKGTPTNNTTGGTSSGTINWGKQIKIGAGYYTADTYYTAQAAPSGNIQLIQATSTDVTNYATATVRSAVFSDMSGGTLSGTATASSSTANLSSTNNSGVSITTACTASRTKVSCTTSTAGWASGTVKELAAGSKAMTASTYYVNGVTLTAPSSGTRTFSVTVPNGTNPATATFVFNVDSSGNVTITES